MPSCTPLFVDKLAMTLNLDDEAARDAISEWIQHSGGQIMGYQVTSTRGGRYYSYSKLITFDASRDITLLVELSPLPWRQEQDYLDDIQDPESVRDIDVADLSGRRRPFRIEFNPASLRENPVHHQAFRSIMQQWFGDALYNEIRNANITRIDFATDVIGVNINSLLISRLDNTVASTAYSRDGSIQTMYLGSKNSSKRFVVYDKRAQRAGRGATHIHQRPRTRIEVRLKMGFSLDELRAHPNPFHGLGIRLIDDMVVAGRGNSPHYWEWMVAAAKQDGLQATLGRIRNPRTRKAWKDRVFERVEPSWWNPETLWSGLNAALNEVGIFPPEGRIRRIRESEPRGSE